MTPTTVEAIYAIRHKATGQFIRANGKGCWMSKSAAQSSWNNDGWINGQEKFSEQDECEIVDMLELLLDEQLGRKFDCEILSEEVETLKAQVIEAECDAVHTRLKLNVTVAALSNYANKENWLFHGESVPQVWCEPDSSSPEAYAGYELAVKALEKL